MKQVCRSLSAISGEHFCQGCLESRPDGNISMARGYRVVQLLPGHMKVDVTFGSAKRVIRALPFSMVVNKSILDKCHHCVHSKVVKK